MALCGSFCRCSDSTGCILWKVVAEGSRLERSGKNLVGSLGSFQGRSVLLGVLLISIFNRKQIINS